MKSTTLITCLSVLAALALIVPATVAEDEAAKAIFVDHEKCNMCHAVSTQGIEAKTTSEKMKGPDLVNLELEAEWIAKYLKKEVEKDGKAHLKPFKGTDEELQALVDWLLDQKTES